ncbi:MAG: GNAT family N-acetyltransferase [Sulfitobacter sp.]
MQVRRAFPQEAAELSALIFASKQSNGYDDAFMALCVDELRVTAQDIRDQMIWVAADETLLGCVTLDPAQGVGTGAISSFFIDPAHQRKGVGRTLWARVLQEAQALHLTKLTLDADPEAVSFYEAMGFAVTGQRPSGSIAGRMLPLMELDLRNL